MSKKVAIIYWSSTGNTQNLAEKINDTISKKYETAIKEVTEDGNIELVKESDIILLGCPAMGSEELDPESFEPFYESIKDILKDKEVGFFGSYEWAEGQWIEDWKNNAEEAGITVKAVCPVHEQDNEDFDPQNFISNF